jgi:iron complex transport system substrate-binding protein
MRKATSILAMALAAALALFAATSAAQYPMQLKDGTNAIVTLKAEPRRIVSIVPSVTEMVYAVGLGDRLVGVTAWCTYPEEAKKLPKVGDMNINIEAVLALKPDLVVADVSMSSATIEKLRELGLPLLAVNARNISEMLEALVLLGTAGGMGNEARILAASLNDRVEKVKRAVASAKSAPSVFVEIWNEPLMTAGSDTYVHELITLAGGRNIAARTTGWPMFSSEAVIADNPDLILLTNFNKDEAMGRKAWSGLSAVKSGNVVEFNPDLLVRACPRLIDGLEMLVKLLHPELFR